MKPKVYFEWWAYRSMRPGKNFMKKRYNFHLRCCANGNILVGSNQGYNNQEDMFNTIRLVMTCEGAEILSRDEE